ncbi:DgyrCDS2248 [Dimorphilus gyrociliatus]|uniref:DgyrCDS2248 n=1 Tax=Dimorphilus gyrociliatus TaxID=2664684 RepID=A0A7I8V9Y5_9ANNE|nr:DgyrCDS2248 [Dimorphilus gyrociliatus]
MLLPLLSVLIFLDVTSSIKDPEALNFIALGDWGTDKVPDEVDYQERVANKMAEWANETGLNFILTLGDNFYPVGANSVDDEQFNRKWRQVYLNPHPSLRVEWQISLGNHDHYLDNGKHQLEFSKVEPLWKIPKFFYTFTKKVGFLEVLFVVVDTESMYFTSNKGEQLDFLNTTLANSHADWSIVAAHHPIFSTALHGNHEDLIDELRPILIEHKVDFYIFGHDHVLQHLTGPSFDSVTYIGSGGGGQFPTVQIPEHLEELKKWNITSNMFKNTNGFTAVKITKEYTVIDFIDYNGEKFYSITKTKS